MIGRRAFFLGWLAMGAAAVAGRTGRTLSAETGDTLVVKDDGTYTQSWFLDSFLELRDDLEEAAGEGRRFAIIWEQKGCPYCKETHVANFGRPEVRDFVRENFTILQLDIWGAREVTDLDGETMEERQLARKAGVTFTPTIQFLPEPEKLPDAATLKEAEIVRMPGYFRPFHFLNMFRFVHEKRYEETDFQRYLRGRLEEAGKSGEKPSTW